MLRTIICTLILTFGIVGSTNAEQKQSVGNFDIHYIALGSTFLTPNVATTYGIQRSNYTGIVNVSVLDTSKEGTPSIPVEISGIANNLLDARVELTFREIREGEAIYYIAEVPYRDDQEINFQISIKSGNRLNTQLAFKQKFYVE